MAKNIIDKKISVSERVADLHRDAQLIYTWSTYHTNTLGLLPRSPRILKALVVPMWEIEPIDFSEHVENIIKQGLYQLYKHTDGEVYLTIGQSQPVTKKSKVEVKTEQKKVTAVERNFELFWFQYPNKVVKKKAHEAWLKHRPTGELFASIMQGLERAKKSAQWAKDNGKYIPHPTTWLNQERWTDEGNTAPTKKIDKF